MCKKEDIFIPPYKKYKKIIQKYKDAADEEESSIETLKYTDSGTASFESSNTTLETTESSNAFDESSDETFTLSKFSTSTDMSSEIY